MGINIERSLEINSAGGPMNTILNCVCKIQIGVIL